MNYNERKIKKTLKKNPDHAYVTPDGRRVYVLFGDGRLMYQEGNFGSMTNDQIDKFICDSLSA